MTDQRKDEMPFITDEFQIMLLKNELAWWKNWAIQGNCLAVLCEANKGVMVKPDQKMWDMTKETMETMCQNALAESFERSNAFKDNVL